MNSRLTRMTISRTRIAAKSTNRSTLQSRQNLKLACCLLSLALWSRAISDAPQALHCLTDHRRKQHAALVNTWTSLQTQKCECVALPCYASSQSSAPELLQVPPVLDVILIAVAGLLNYLHRASG